MRVGALEHTGIGDWNWGGIDISEITTQRRNNGKSDRASSTDDDGPEEGGTFASCPAAVLEGSRPEERRSRHFGRFTCT